MLAFNAKNPFGYGRVETKGKIVIRVTEEFQANQKIKKILLCNSGILICNYNFLFTNIKKISNKNIKKEKYITDLFEIAYQTNNHFSYSICSEEELQGINTREQLYKADESLQNELKKKIIVKGATILQPNTVRVSLIQELEKIRLLNHLLLLRRE